MEDFTSIYQIDKSWEENLELGPNYTQELPKRQWPNEDKWIDFLGHRVASRIGVPSGPLLDSRWTTLAAQLGYDLVWYKTVRSYAHASHPLPNIVFVDSPDRLEPAPDLQLHTRSEPRSLDSLAITNSFGNPSMHPDYLRCDIRRAREQLAPGQLLICSIYGRSIEEFTSAAEVVVSGGAQVIEANFSCPNLGTDGGSLYADPRGVEDFCAAIKTVIGGKPLLIKAGSFADQGRLAEVLHAAVRGGAAGIAGINTVSGAIRNPDGTPALGPKRPTAGICGAPIRHCALSFVSQTREIIERDALPLELVGGGGITRPEHFDLFLKAGADVVTTATGMMWRPLLAHAYHTQHKEVSHGRA